MFSKKISVLVLMLIIVDACEGKSSSKKHSKPAGKRSSKNAALNRAYWPFRGDISCEEVSTLDTDYHTKSVEDDGKEFKSWSKCGMNHKNSDSKSKEKSNIFQKYLSKLEQSVENIKTLTKGDRIINGYRVEEGDWPWLVAIGSLEVGLYCGGSIIGDRWVLTAAHCFEDLEKPCSFNVRVGTRNWLMDTDRTGVDRRVVGIYRHPDYDSSTTANDIALLKLEAPLELDPDSSINAICLPTGAKSVKPGRTCFIAGWGLQAEDDHDTLSMVSMETTLPVIGYDKDQCGDYPELLPGMLCAGYTDGTSDTCQGDSGGPLTYRKNGKYYQLGVTSWGKGCAHEGYPGIYTDVGQFLPFIKSVLKRHQ